jgi:hypothetical protein
MTTHQEFYSRKINELAEHQGYLMFETKRLNNGLWSFRKGYKTKKLDFDFQDKYFWVRKGLGNMYEGKRIEYGNIEQEQELYQFIKEFLNE